MPRLCLGLLAARALLATACGAESVTAEEPAPTESTQAAGTARAEIVMRMSMGDGTGTQEFRSREVLDYKNDRSSYVDQTTGCETITIGDVTYFQLLPDDEMPLATGRSSTCGQ